MKNKLQLEENDNIHDLEILKAVAQAWHGRSGSSRTTANEFDTHRLSFKSKPTRFKLEAMNKPKDTVLNHGVHWDFGQSLLDSYELVSLSKRLEAGLVLDHEFSELENSRLSRKRRKESKNSLRNLFGKMSSGRFSDAEATQEEGT
ncbi:hypothetical protein Vadar_001479 [Vaccinium darrowii]|uniref:Uncharacterized protein n=1 Tax=Vaccinium darrowii TaxID=229202 RepID=A0ACB7ZGF4_9ERIC|nr:hypothetical protein Vadar_001479 [Vaccinium darrowii]